MFDSCNMLREALVACLMRQHILATFSMNNKFFYLTSDTLGNVAHALVRSVMFYS